MKELDTVVLTHNIDEHDLKEGDVGAIVYQHKPGVFEVEFVTAEGETVAVLTLNKADVKSIEGRKILHIRNMDETTIHPGL